MFCQLSSGLLPLEHLWRWSKFLVFLLVGIAPDFYFLGSLTWEDSPRRGLSWSLSLFSFRSLLPSFLPLPCALQLPLAESPSAGCCTASPRSSLSPSRAVEPISLTPVGAHSAQKTSMLYHSNCVLVCIFLWGHLSTPLIIVCGSSSWPNGGRPWQTG